MKFQGSFPSLSRLALAAVTVSCVTHILGHVGAADHHHVALASDAEGIFFGMSQGVAFRTFLLAFYEA